MRFHIIGLCFTNARDGGIAFHHDLGLVALSYVIAAAGSYAALEMIERWRQARGFSKHYWQIASALTLGGSIWSMHFVAILALTFELPITYASGMTALSLLIAVASVGCGLQILGENSSIVRIGSAGITVGLGIAAMHYVGMAALSFPGTLAYIPSIWGLSLLVGIAAATVAFWLSLTVRVAWQRAGAALVMGLAICGMHYTGMASTIFQADPITKISPGLSGGPLAAGVALATLALIVCALVFVAADRRVLEMAKREAVILRESNTQLALANTRLDIVLDNMSQGVTFFDSDQKLIVCNRHYGEIYRLSPSQVRPGISLSEILDFRLANGTFPGLTRAAFLARREALSRAAEPYDLVEELPNGRTISMHYQPLPNGGWVTTHEDITERRQAEIDLVFMARHDALTKLPNRLLFRERMEQALITAGRGGAFAVICLDLDNFKQVNDTLGHPIGDALLVAAANRLRNCTRDGDTVARLGGDEFAIIQTAVRQPEDAAVLGARIVAAFHERFDIDGHQITVGVSVGATVAPGDSTSYEVLMRNADTALYLAKTEGRGTVRFFEPEMDARIHMRRVLELELANALSRNEFELYYQPLVSLVTNKIIGFEALLRWHHTVRGLVSPLDFIPVAEETGMIVAIGEWALRTACLEACNWPSDIGVAVNLSPVQFKNDGLVAVVQAALAASGLPSGRLELEITESALLHDSASTLIALHQLRLMGIGVALDDFGTGYSSLSYLHKFPFSKLKIDQSFVRSVMTSKESMSIIRAVTGLGQGLGIKTIAEGVETVEQLDILRAEGCSEGQGYFFSQPRPACELPQLIERLNNVLTVAV